MQFDLSKNANGLNDVECQLHGEDVLWRIIWEMNNLKFQLYNIYGNSNVILFDIIFLQHSIKKDKVDIY